jgi:hypothetical protein
MAGWVVRTIPGLFTFVSHWQSWQTRCCDILLINIPPKPSVDGPRVTQGYLGITVRSNPLVHHYYT